MKKNKYLYLNVVQGLYGTTWEDLTASECYRECNAEIKAYRKNAPETKYRIIKRRELNT